MASAPTPSLAGTLRVDSWRARVDTRDQVGGCFSHLGRRQWGLGPGKNKKKWLESEYILRVGKREESRVTSGLWGSASGRTKFPLTELEKSVEKASWGKSQPGKGTGSRVGYMLSLRHSQNAGIDVPQSEFPGRIALGASQQEVWRHASSPSLSPTMSLVQNCYRRLSQSPFKSH